MRLSIVIPIYNSKNTIEELFKSITMCTNPDMEVILVDDGSTDGSEKLCDELIKVDARCKVIHKKNAGVSSARNAGIDAAQGDYIFFCDSDDFVFSNVLDESITNLSIDVDLFIFDYIYKFITSGKTSKSSFKLQDGIVLDKGYIINNILSPLILKESTDMASLWHKFFKRSIIEKHNIRFEEDIHKGEDWRFILDYLSVAQTAFYIPKVIYEYRLNGTQIETKYKKVLGIHFLGGYKRKLELNNKFQLNASESQVWRWYAGVIEEIVYIAKNRCNKSELRKILLDNLSQQSSRILLHTKLQIYVKNEVSRKYWIYALLIRYHMLFLLKILAKMTR